MYHLERAAVHILRYSGMDQTIPLHHLRVTVVYIFPKYPLRFDRLYEIMLFLLIAETVVVLPNYH